MKNNVVPLRPKREESISRIRSAVRQEVDMLAVRAALDYDEMLQAGERNARQKIMKDLPLKLFSIEQRLEVGDALDLIELIQRARQALPHRN